MGSRRTSIFENGLIWFGAGVSLAEILTGTYFASLGFSTGLLAIIIGHIIGCGMMFFAGFIFTFLAFAIAQFGLLAVVKQGYAYLGYAAFITLFIPFIIHVIVTKGKEI